MISLQPDPIGETTDETEERTFALVSGHAGQARALARLAARERIGFEGRLAVLHGPSRQSEALGNSLARQLLDSGAMDVICRPVAAGDIAVGCRAVLLVGPADPSLVDRIVGEAIGRDPALVFLVPRALAAAILSRPRPDLVGRLLLAAPDFADGLDATAADAVARLLVEGLKTTGRTLDRSRFIAAMERLTELRIARVPLLHYGPGRHVGARGAAIFRLGPEGRSLQTVVSWLDLDASHGTAFDR